MKPAAPPARALSDAEVMQPAEPQSSIFTDNPVTRVAKAFGAEFSRTYFGPENMPGLSAESTKWMSDKGIFGKADGYGNPFQAFNELVIETSARMWNAGAAAFRGGQEAVQQIGEELGSRSLGRDIAAIPEAFFGSPHPTGIASKESVARTRWISFASAGQSL